VIPDVIKNSAVKIVHRLPALDDRQAVGAAMNLKQSQSEYLVTLVPGEAAVHADGMDYPLLVRMPDGTDREAGPVVTAPPELVISRRSLTCGTDCLAEACTLGQMHAAQRLDATDRRIALWAELAVVAHLTGWEIPRPSPMLTAALQATDGRLRDCAISQAVDAAVAARVPGMTPRVSPAALASHVASAMRQVISLGTPGCASEEPEYLAPPYRWMLVRAALRTGILDQGRHPRSDEWERVYGGPIPGDNGAHQLRVINRRYTQDQCDSRAIRIVIWGARSRPAIEQAVGARAGSDDWAARLTDALAAFARLQWPHKLLDRPGAAPGRVAAGKQAAGE
jgi:hypothetical protein